MTKASQGQSKRIGYKVIVPGQDPVTYGLDELEQARAHYIRVKDIGGKWYEIHKGSDGIVKDNPMPDR